MPSLPELVLILGYIIIMPSLFFICVFWVVRDWKLRSQLRLLGRLADAEVISLRTSGIIRGRSYYVVYGLRLHILENDRPLEYLNEQEISKTNYQKLEQGSFVKVSYLPKDPQISRLAGENTDSTSHYRATYYAILLGAVWIAIFTKLMTN